MEDNGAGELKMRFSVVWVDAERSGILGIKCHSTTTIDSALVFILVFIPCEPHGEVKRLRWPDVCYHKTLQKSPFTFSERVFHLPKCIWLPQKTRT